MDEDEYRIYFAKFDTNNDDKISIREFVSTIQPLIKDIDGQNEKSNKTPSILR